MGSLLTASKAAEILAVSPQTIYRYAQEGRIPSVKIGPGAVRFDPEEIAKYIKKCRRPAL